MAAAYRAAAKRNEEPVEARIIRAEQKEKEADQRLQRATCIETLTQAGLPASAIGFVPDGLGEFTDGRLTNADKVVEHVKGEVNKIVGSRKRADDDQGGTEKTVGSGDNDPFSRLFSPKT